MKKFVYTTFYDHGTESTITKVFADIPKAAIDAIAEADGWDGCHWDAPALIYCEQVYDSPYMSDECDQLIRMLGATEYEEEE